MFVQCFQICMLTCSHGLQCCSSILCWHQKMSFLYSGTQRLFSSLNCNRSVTDARIPHIVSRFIVQGYCQSKCIKRPSLDSSWYSLQNCIKIWPCFCVTYCTHSSSAILYTLTKEGRKGKDMIFVIVRTAASYSRLHTLGQPDWHVFDCFDWSKVLINKKSILFFYKAADPLRLSQKCRLTQMPHNVFVLFLKQKIYTKFQTLKKLLPWWYFADVTEGTDCNSMQNWATSTRTC